MQCGQGNLLDETSDCVQQVSVRCPNTPGTRTFCFTRQLLIGPGKCLRYCITIFCLVIGENAIEKMCVTNVGLMQEYGNQVPLEGCTMANRDRVRFCVCDSNDCNRAPLNEQVTVQGYGISIVPDGYSTAEYLHFVHISTSRHSECHRSIDHPTASMRSLQ
jgi:hypothetical protein